MNNRLSILLLSLFLIPAFGYSQTPVLEQDVEADTLKSTRGPNRTHYIHNFITLGTIVTGSKDATVNSLLNYQSEIGYGIRYKYKLSSHIDLGVDLQISSHSIFISQDAGKLFPDTTIYNKQKLQRFSVPASAFIRINYGRRGDFIAKFIDLGVYGDMKIRERMKVWEITETSSTLRSIIGGTEYMSDFHYGAYCRVGWNKYAVMFKYRPVALINDLPAGYTDLIPYTLSVQIGLHK